MVRIDRNNVQRDSWELYEEDQLMTAAIGTWPKQMLNRVMDALYFEYPNYERLDKGARGAKRKRVVSILSRQVVWSVKTMKI
jgi:hypothetical protein